MIGQTISHYKILEKLGEGGMSVVYKAQDTKLDRLVALKFLPHHTTAHESEKARFVQEAKAAAALNHPSICTIHGIEEHDNQQFIVMEFVDGATLREKLDKGSLPTKDAIGYAIQIGEALQEAHSKGIVHRDIKAENIMVNSKNYAKVMDFGLAKLKGSLKLTRTSSTVGTLAYMAPEQIEGQETDGRSDIFSFGVVVYEMLTGHFPFRGEHEAAMMYSIVNEEPQPIQKFLPEVSSELVHVLNRALEKNPDDRYQNVSEMVIDLRRLRKETTRVSREIPVDRDFSRPGERARVPSRSQRSKILAGIATGVLVIAVVLAYVLFFGPPKPIDSIAVLPFVNASADSTAEYLSDGITEHLINDLTKISKLRVIPRSTVFHYKGNESDPLKIGRDLKVAVVVTGKLRQRGENLTLQTELLDVREQSQLWDEQYKRRTSELLLLQEDIAKDIADKLRLKLTGDEQSGLAKEHSTDNVEAYELYLKGRYQWNKRTDGGFRQAIQHFEQAFEKDPKYAAAYAGLADVYVTQASWGFATPSEAYPRARAAALKSLELDHKFAEPYASLAWIKEEYDRDWRGAEQDYRRSLELNPGYAHAHHWYGLFLSRMGKHEEAIAELQSAVKLDPLSPMISTNVGRVLYNARQYDKAIRQLRKTIDMDPEFSISFVFLAMTYGQLGMIEEATTAARKANKHPEVDPDYGYIGWVYARAGRKVEAQRILRRLQELAKQQYIDPGSIAMVYLGLGQNSQALIWLERALDVRGSFQINYLKVDPVWDPVRNDPRFLALLKKTGLEK